MLGVEKKMSKTTESKYYYTAKVVIQKRSKEDNAIVRSAKLNHTHYTQDKKTCRCTICKNQKRAIFKVRRAHDYINICHECYATLLMPKR